MSLPPPGRSSRGCYGQQWGEGVARCFSIENDWDEDESVRLLPIPECFICPMSQTPMEDPVMTVDGCVYERAYIEHWIRHRQQQSTVVTSPATNRELPSTRLVSLTALKKAIETYLDNRPELRASLTSGRSFEEAAQILQHDLFEKQVAHVRVEDELSLLRDSNESLVGALEAAERAQAASQQELEQARAAQRASQEALQPCRKQVRELEDRCNQLSRELGHSARYAGLAGGESLGAKVQHGVPKGKQQGQGVGHAYCALLVLLMGVSACIACLHHSWRWNEAAPIGNVAHLAAGKAGGLERRGDLHALSILPLGENLQHMSLEDVRLSREVGMIDSGPNESRWTGEVHDRLGDDLDVKTLGAVRDTDVASSITDGIGCSGHDDVRIVRQVAQLEDGTVDEKTNAALVLGILATTGPDKQACIVRAGAIVQLVELLRGDWPEARGQAAVALRALAANSTYNKVAIVRAGAIQPLIQILKQDAVDVQEVAAGCLATLAETNNQVEIVQAGAIVSLVALLNDERPEAREEAAGTLVVLAQNVAARAAIAQVGAIPMLVDLLSDPVPEVRVRAASALRHLAAEDLADPSSKTASVPRSERV